VHRGGGCWVGRVCGVLSFMVNFWCSGLVVDGWEVDELRPGSLSCDVVVRRDRVLEARGCHQVAGF
jgi:hypothetical protein